MRPLLLRRRLYMPHQALRPGAEGGGEDPDPATVSYVTYTAGSSVSEFAWTFTNHAIGSAAANRRVVVVAMGIGANHTPGEPICTIGGNAATRHDHAQGAIDEGDGRAYIAMFSLDVPSGTTATIVVNWQGSGGFYYDTTIAVYAVYGSGLIIPATSNASGAGGASANVSLNVQPGDVVIAGDICYNASTTVTWTGVTERHESNLYGDDRRSSGDAAISSAESPRSIVATRTIPASDFMSHAAVSAVFRPAA